MPRLLVPPAAGIDISDSSVKWIVLERHGLHLRVRAFGEAPLEKGVVESGVIRDTAALAHVLASLGDELEGVTCAHAALPEEPAYVFGMRVPYDTPRDQVLRMIEFEFEGRVPIPPSAAVYDYTVIPSPPSDSEEIGVTVFPREIADSYVEAFSAAGLTLLSLEVEARSIARAITSGRGDEPVTLVADIGRARTGFAVLKRGIPIFTSTVDVGGDVITDSLLKMGMTEAEAGAFKNHQGLVGSGTKKTREVEAVVGTAAALTDEVVRHFHYWDTRRAESGEKMTPVGCVLLVGGNANLRGLPDYIAGRVQAPTERGNVWRHVASFEQYIPPIDRFTSMQYATAIGLALRAA